MSPLAISSYTSTNAAGTGKTAIGLALHEGRSGLVPNSLDWAPLTCWIGRVAGLDGHDAVKVLGSLAEFDCRNNRLAMLGLEQDGFVESVAIARRRYGKERVGVFLGTSTSGILSTEFAYQQREPQSGRLPANYCYETTHNLDATTDRKSVV